MESPVPLRRSHMAHVAILGFPVHRQVYSSLPVQGQGYSRLPGSGTTIIHQCFALPKLSGTKFGAASSGLI